MAPTSKLVHKSNFWNVAGLDTGDQVCQCSRPGRLCLPGWIMCYAFLLSNNSRFEVSNCRYSSDASKFWRLHIFWLWMPGESFIAHIASEPQSTVLEGIQWLPPIHSWQKERAGVTAHLVDFKSVGAALQPSLHPYNPPPLSPILCRPDGKTHFVASNLSNSQWKENLYDFSSPGIRVRFTTKATNQKCSNFSNNIKGAKFSEN